MRVCSHNRLKQNSIAHYALKWSHRKHDLPKMSDDNHTQKIKSYNNLVTHVHERYMSEKTKTAGRGEKKNTH
jgi:hypothetical protein